MVNSWREFLMFVVILVIVFDSNHAAVRERRSLFFGKNDQTTTRTVLKSPLGFVSVSLAGGQKAPEDPCLPSQDTQQSSGRKPLINIKIPTLFNRGSNQATQPPECATVASTSEHPATHSPITHSPTTHSPTTHSPTTHSPITHNPTTHSHPPEPSSIGPVKYPTPKPHHPSTLPPISSPSGHVGSTSTVDPDDELINSIFGAGSEEGASTTAANNGAGLIDLRRPFS